MQEIWILQTLLPQKLSSNYMKKSLIQNGEASSFKMLLQIRVLFHGNVIWKVYIRTLKGSYQILLIGALHMVYGLVKHQQFLLLNLDGCILLQILFNSTMYSQDQKEDSLNKLILMLMTSIVLLIIGSTKTHQNMFGNSHKRCSDGLNGKTELTLCLLINLKLDGISYLIEDLM